MCWLFWKSKAQQLNLALVVRSAALDGFLLTPAKLTKRFTGPDGAVVLTYDIELGKLSIEEQ